MFRVITEENGKPSDLALETLCESLARHMAETLVLPRGGRITIFSNTNKVETVYCLPGHSEYRAKMLNYRKLGESHDSKKRIGIA